MTFSGIDGKGKWHDTPVQDVLPVTVSRVDDRMEHCEGILPVMEKKDHPVFSGIDGEFPAVLGYNKTALKEGAELLASIEGNPFIAWQSFKKGKAAVFTTDCAPHWAPPEFCGWKHYNRLFQQLIDFICA